MTSIVIAYRWQSLGCFAPSSLPFLWMCTKLSSEVLSVTVSVAAAYRVFMVTVRAPSWLPQFSPHSSIGHGFNTMTASESEWF